MKRLLKRLTETGAVCWFGFAMMMAGGALVASSAHVMISTGGSSRASSEMVMDSSNMATFWWITAIASAVIGVGVFRSPGSKK